MLRIILRQRNQLDGRTMQTYMSTSRITGEQLPRRESRSLLDDSVSDCDNNPQVTTETILFNGGCMRAT